MARAGDQAKGHLQTVRCDSSTAQKALQGFRSPPSNAKAEIHRKPHAEFVSEMGELHPNAVVMWTYTTGLTPVLIGCKVCGNKAEVVPNNALRQGYCRICGDVAGAETRSLGGAESEQRLQALFPRYRFDSLPSRQDERVHFTCSVGHRDSGLAKELFQGKGCIHCARAGRDSVPVLLREPDRAQSKASIYFVLHDSGLHKIGISCNSAEVRGNGQYIETFLEIKARRATVWAIEQVMLLETAHSFDEAEWRNRGLDIFGGWRELRYPLHVEQTCKRIKDLLLQAKAKGWLRFYCDSTGYLPKPSIRALFEVEMASSD